IALPLATTVIFIIIFQIGFGSFNNPVIQVISTILLYIANIFLTSFLRELARAALYRITLADGLIDERVDPNDHINLVEGAHTLTLNDIQLPAQYTIGFVGDIMMLKGHNLVFHSDITKFFKGVDIIVGNLEGIVNENNNALFAQVHLPKILLQLQDLLPHNVRWLLCLSNNHSIDFGNIDFHNSLMDIDQSQISYVFGGNDVPHVHHQNPDPLINVATATRWSNKHNWDCISEYEDIRIIPGMRAHHINAHFNILYPHWGYENERYVRNSIQDEARAWLTDPNNPWDLIFGHHPHVRQPIMAVPVITATGVPFDKLV
ncbi:unnamed protein product, partial [marine sediment metagenome]